MDMKRILQTIDSASNKSEIISEGKGPLNRATAAESIAMQQYAEPIKKTITNPVLNVQEGATPSMIGKYFKAVEEELNEAAERSKDRSRQLAERVATTVNELSNDTLASYKKKASADATAADKAGDFEKGNKRFKGITKATIKQFDNDAKKHKKQGVAEGFLNEASSDEAWELVGQPVPEIREFVKQMGYANNEQSVEKITPIIDRASSTKIPVESIPKLKNLANKNNDAQTLKAVQKISGSPDAEQQYIKLMQARDADEGRKRDITGYIKYVKSGNYDPPVLLKLPTGLYVIGGRTRLYAALALGVPAKVKIISANDFKQDVADELNEAEGTPSGVAHLTRELLTHIVQQSGKEGAHAIIKSLTWGDGAAKELLHLIVDDLKDDIKGIDESNLSEIAKGAKDSNGFTKCWPGKHAEGTKKGKNGGRVRNCVPNEAANPAQQAAIAIAKKKAGKK